MNRKEKKNKGNEKALPTLIKEEPSFPFNQKQPGTPVASIWTWHCTE
jgi:hypothetical protein